MRPTVCLYPCSTCCQVINWYDECMYLMYNPDETIQTFKFLFMCENCFVDSVIVSFDIFHNFFDDNTQTIFESNTNIFNYNYDITITTLKKKKYYYIDNNLKAILTQDTNYFNNNNWFNKNYDDYWLIGHKFKSPSHIFIFFLLNYDKDVQFIKYILNYIFNTFDNIISYNNIFIDNLITKSLLNYEDKHIFINKINKQKYYNYLVSGLNNFFLEDIFQIIIQY